MHRSERSELMVAAAMDHGIDGPASTEVLTESFADLGRVTVTVSLERGQ